MIEYDKLEEWFDNLPKDRKIFIQKQYFEYNKYFEELNRGWWFDEDFKYNTVRFAENYGGQFLLDREFEQLKLLEYE